MPKKTKHRNPYCAGLSLLLIFFLLSFTACSPGKESSKVTVNIFQFKVEIVDGLEKIISVYEKENPDVKINLETVGGGDDYGASLRAKMQSEEPTIFNVGGLKDLKVWKNKLEDLSDQPWVPYAAKGSLDNIISDHKVYGLPFNIEGYGFIYNTAIFKAAGIDVSQINNYDSLEKALRKLKEKIDSGALKKQFPHLEAVFEFPAKEKWVSGIHTFNVALANEYKNAAELSKIKEPDLAYADSLRKLIDLQADYSSNANNKERLNAVDYATQVGGGIAIERVAVIQQGNWIYNEVANIDKDVLNKLSLMPIPLKGGREDSIPVGVPMYWVINKDASPAQKAAAKKFLNWLYQSDEGKKLVVDELRFIPPFINYQGLTPGDPLGKAVKSYVDRGKTIPWLFTGFPYGAGMDSFGVYVQKYLSGKMTWDQVISATKAQWKKARAEESSE